MKAKFLQDDKGDGLASKIEDFFAEVSLEPSRIVEIRYEIEQNGGHIKHNALIVYKEA